MSLLGLETYPLEESPVLRRDVGDATQRLAEGSANDGEVAVGAVTVPHIARALGADSQPSVHAEGRPDIAAIASRLQTVFSSRFEVLKPLAIGGMATIFQLRHRLHGGLFVAKVLHPELAERKGVIASFRTEARNAAALGGHPNAVPVFDMGELDGLFFIVMPYVVGEDLDQLLQRTGTFDESEALQMAAQLSSLLSYAEAQDIVHCDLTPGNIRLDHFGNYRLLDFGISLRVGEVRTAFAGGTPLYASPQQLRGEPVDVRSDLYSLGTILAEVLTGRPLFHGDSLEEIRQRHMEGKWTLPAELPPDGNFARLLQHLLATDPANRIGSAFELSGILDALGYVRPEFRRRATMSLRSEPAEVAAAPRSRLTRQ